MGRYIARRLLQFVPVLFGTMFLLHYMQSLSVQEMFVLCQEFGFEVDITVGEPANGNNEMGFSVELDLAA